MRGWILSLAATATFVVLTGCAGTDLFDIETFTAFAQDNQVVRKSSTSNNAFVIYTSAGSNPFHLRYSRGGNNLVFSVDTSIVTMLGNGSGIVEIPGYKAADWNMDGTRLYAVTNLNQIVTMDPDGTNVSAPLFDGSAGGGITSIDVSPDGNRILFSYAPTAVGQVYIMDADGSGAVAITGVGSSAGDARWNFDGTRVVYTRTMAGNADIYAIDPDGTNNMALADTVAQERTPSFETSGRILFSKGTGNAEIWEMDADGSAQVLFHTGTGSLSFPDSF